MTAPDEDAELVVGDVAVVLIVVVVDDAAVVASSEAVQADVVVEMNIDLLAVYPGAAAAVQGAEFVVGGGAVESVLVVMVDFGVAWSNFAVFL